MVDRAGSEIAGYRIESLIARGGMGEVYLAAQSFPERRVALKLLPHDLASDPAFRERFIRESNAAASLEHPNIVPVYGAGESDGDLWIAMRFVDGEDLRSLLNREGPLPLERAASICVQVAEALEEAHEHDLVHRDVKPGNILISKGDRSYLTDFGLIRRSKLETDLTKTGQFMGTVDYVAPEQIKGQTVDGRADVYSLGCVLYECLTGEPPFRRETEVATLYAHLEDPPPVPSAMVPSVQPRLDEVVGRAMAKEPDERYPTAAELATSIGSAAQPRTIAATESFPERGRRRRLTAAIVGVAVVVAAAVTLVTRHDGSTAVPPTVAAPPLGSLLSIDPGSEKIGTTIPRAFPASGFQSKATIELGEGGVWVGSQQVLVHVDERTKHVRARIPTCSASLAIASRLVWLGDFQRVDPATDEILLRPILPPSQLAQLGAGSTGGCDTSVAAGDGEVWFGLGSGLLLTVDPSTGKLTDEIDLGGSINDIAFGEGSVWVADDLGGTVTPVSPQTHEAGTEIPVQGDVDRIAVGLGKVWVLDRKLGAVTPIDADTDAVGSPIRVGGSPSDLAMGLGSVWVANQGDGTISEIDPVTEREVRTIPVGGPVAAIAVDELPGALWVVLGFASGFG